MSDSSYNRSFIGLYTPYLIDEELERLRENPDKILNFRPYEYISNGIIQQDCDFIMEGIPFERVSSGYSRTSNFNFNNRVLSKYIPYYKPIISNPVITTTTGDFHTISSRAISSIANRHFTPVGEGENETQLAYQAFYSEFVVENRFDVLGGYNEGDTIAGGEVNIYVLALEANYVITEGEDIVELSPLLQQQIESWAIATEKDSYTNEDFYGEGTVIYGEKVTLREESRRLVTDIERVSVDLVHMKVGSYELNGNISGRNFVVLRCASEDDVIRNPTVHLTGKPRELEITSTGIVATDTESGTQMTIRKSEGSDVYDYVYGWGQQNKTYIITFPGNIQRSVTLRDGIEFRVVSPIGELTHEMIDEGLLTIREALPDEYVDGMSSLPDKSLSHIYNLPTLNIVDSRINPYSPYVKNLMQVHVPRQTKSASVENYKFSATKIKSGLVLSGLYVGRLPTISRWYLGTLDDGKGQFLSWPGSIIQEAGVALFGYRYQTTTPQIDLYDLTPESLPEAMSPLGAISVGCIPYTIRNQVLATSWISDNLSTRRTRVRIPYQIDKRTTRVNYKLSWEENSELYSLSTRMNTRWISDIPVNRSTITRIPYEIRLPSDRNIRQFLNLSWNSEIPRNFRRGLNIPWTEDHGSREMVKLKTAWISDPADSVVVTPFYMIIKEGTERIKTAAFSVACTAKMSPRLKDMSFLLSAPPKFQLIDFDLEGDPYPKSVVEVLNSWSGRVVTEGVRPVNLPENYTHNIVILAKNVQPGVEISLDVLLEGTKLNSNKTHYIPTNIATLGYDNHTVYMLDNGYSVYPLPETTDVEYYEDIVELDLVISEGSKCCFVERSNMSRCSPY